MRADAWGNRWASKRLSGFLTKICIAFSPAAALSRPRSSGAGSQPGRDAALLNLLRTKVRETETVRRRSLSPAALKYYARTFCRPEPPFQHGLRDDDPERNEAALTVKQIQQRLGETQ